MFYYCPKILSHKESITMEQIYCKARGCNPINCFTINRKFTKE